jgi:hypothetical protein
MAIERVLQSKETCLELSAAVSKAALLVKTSFFLLDIVGGK